MAATGEPIRLFLDPAGLSRLLKQVGFSDSEDIGFEEINDLYFSRRTDGLRMQPGLNRFINARI
jgi:hypothetical protein